MCLPPRPYNERRRGLRPGVGADAGAGGAHAPGSGLPLDHPAQVQLALGGHDGLPVLQVVVDQVADALKQHVLRPHLQDQRPQQQQPRGWRGRALCRTAAQGPCRSVKSEPPGAETEGVGLRVPEPPGLWGRTSYSRLNSVPHKATPTS